MESQIFHRLDSLEKDVKLLFQLYKKVSETTETINNVSSLKESKVHSTKVTSASVLNIDGSEFQKTDAHLNRSEEIEIQEVHNQDGKE